MPAAQKVARCARPGSCASASGEAAATGRFLIRLSDSLFLAPQSDLKKKRSKEHREKRPNPGSICFNAEGGIFFWRRKNFRVASSASE
jgi:hypothetical protein